MRERIAGQQPRIGVIYRIPGQGDIEIEHTIDTGFEGELTLPVAAVNAMGLVFDQRMIANLADGSNVLIKMYHATILWHGQERQVKVLAMGNRPLLGTALLSGNDVEMHYEDNGPINIKPI